MDCCRNVRVDGEKSDVVEVVHPSTSDLHQAASWPQVARQPSQDVPIDEYADDDGELSPGRDVGGLGLCPVRSLVSGSKANGEDALDRRSSLGSYSRGFMSEEEADPEDHSHVGRRVQRERTLSVGSVSDSRSRPASCLGSDDESPTRPVKKVMTRWSHSVVLRATDANVVLRRFGTIFISSEGTDADYQLSKPVQALQWFISHNWSTPRLQKWMVLVLHFNFLPASLCTGAALISTLALTAHGALPLASMRDGGRIGVVAQTTGALIFLFVLFTWQELGGRVGLQSSKVFLDKACINQSDAKCKAKDIMRLAAFLKGAEGLLVVYSDTYLRRLWTVYELASVLILYPRCKVKVIPTWFPMYFVCGTIMSYLLYLVFMFSWLQVVEDAIGYPLDIVPAIMGLMSSAFGLSLGRRWLTMQGQIHNAGENFDIGLAAVTEEGDRHLVMNSVEYFMKCEHLVIPQASQEEALQAFNSRVRDQLPRFVMNSFGRRGIPYTYVMMIFLPQTCRLVDLLGAYIHDGTDRRTIVIKVAEYLTMHLAFLPLMVATCSLSLELCPQAYNTVRGVVFVGFTLVASVLSVACWWAMTRVQLMAEDSDLGLAVFFVLCALVVSISWYIFRPAQRPTSHCSSSCCGFRSKKRRSHEESVGSTVDSQPSLNSMSISQSGGGEFEEFQVD